MLSEKPRRARRDLEASRTGRPTSTRPDDHVGDDLLRPSFISCIRCSRWRPRRRAQLRLLGGLTTEEIARAFLVPGRRFQQRVVRAKKTLARTGAFEVPRGADLEARLSSVLGVLYLIFNEGYTATSGDAWIRPSLCEDALRLGRIVAELGRTRRKSTASWR